MPGRTRSLKDVTKMQHAYVQKEKVTTLSGQQDRRNKIHSENRLGRKITVPQQSVARQNSVESSIRILLERPVGSTGVSSTGASTTPSTTPSSTGVSTTKREPYRLRLLTIQNRKGK